ncbi:hypothetical protein CBR_g25761 [Chara braunii]|uniref:Uncharacterized protein n=1 Tax=Chara braunii TaxID=69332 RepID=A0A388L696_CHABU|nr:hypothetical protein CBR_g25761 [Chara braunii]|eukprot:GBG77831.1 hypothetical protein CBR_g25761 [Chara braunii]
MKSFALSNTGSRLGVHGPSPPSRVIKTTARCCCCSKASYRHQVIKTSRPPVLVKKPASRSDCTVNYQAPAALWGRRSAVRNVVEEHPARLAGIIGWWAAWRDLLFHVFARYILGFIPHVSLSDATGFPRANGQEEAHNPVHPRQRRKAGCIVRRKLNTNSLRIQAKKKDEQGKGNGDGVLVGCDCNGEVADVLQKSEELARTRQLVETAMLAATAGLAFFITNLLRLEGYIGCFLPLPPVIAALRWNAAAGRKTMVATLLLLFIIGGPLKAVSYVLLHGMLGMVIGGLWSWHVSWTSSLLLCKLVRMLGLILSVAMSSWFIKENLLALLINQAHASLGQLCVFLGINASPSVSLIIMAVCALIFLNCIVFVFLLHVLPVALSMSPCASLHGCRAARPLAPSFLGVVFAGAAPAVRLHQVPCKLSGVAVQPTMASPGELHRGAAAWLCTLERGQRRLQLIVGELYLQKQQGTEVDRGAISLLVWLAGRSQDMLAIIWELEEGPASQLDPIIDWSQADELLNVCYARSEEGVALRTELEDSIGYLGGTRIIDDDYNTVTNNNTNNNNNSNNTNNFGGCEDCTECTDKGKPGGREDSIGGKSGTCTIGG